MRKIIAFALVALTMPAGLAHAQAGCSLDFFTNVWGASADGTFNYSFNSIQYATKATAQCLAQKMGLSLFQEADPKCDPTKGFVCDNTTPIPEGLQWDNSIYSMSAPMYQLASKYTSKAGPTYTTYHDAGLIANEALVETQAWGMTDPNQKNQSGMSGLDYAKQALDSEIAHEDATADILNANQRALQNCQLGTLVTQTNAWTPGTYQVMCGPVPAVKVANQTIPVSFNTPSPAISLAGQPSLSAPGLIMECTVVQNPLHGSLSVGLNQTASQVVYTPAPGSSGMDSFKISCGQTNHGISADNGGFGTVTLNVAPGPRQTVVNTPPPPAPGAIPFGVLPAGTPPPSSSGAKTPLGVSPTTPPAPPAVTGLGLIGLGQDVEDCSTQVTNAYLEQVGHAPSDVQLRYGTFMCQNGRPIQVLGAGNFSL